MPDRARTKLHSALICAKHILAALCFMLSSPFASAQSVPVHVNVSGGLFYPNNAPILSSNVEFKLEVYDANATCVLYSEVHAGQDLSQTRGGFSLVLGSGTSGHNAISGGENLDTKVFENPGAVTVNECPGLTLTPGDERRLRVSYNLGQGYVAMTPDVPIVSSAYSMVAETLQGKRPVDFLQVRENGTTALSQANAEYAFSATNWNKLKELIDGTSSQYFSSSPSNPIDFKGQRLSNLASPGTSTDAATKGYADAYLGGRSVDFSNLGPGQGGGQTVIWDQTLNKWVTGTPLATDNSKLPLSGGTMSGSINMGGYDITSTGNFTLAPQKVFNLGTFSNTQETALLATMGTANSGASWYSSDLGAYKIWNGSRAVTQAYLDATGKLTAGWLPNTSVNASTYGSATQVPVFTVAGDGRITAASNVTISGVLPGGEAGGDLTGSYPAPSITSGAITNSKISDNAITAAKIKSTGIAANRLIATDPLVPSQLTYFTCNNLNEIMTWTASGWGCTTMSALAPVTSVAGKTGAVTLNALDINGLGQAALKDYGTGAGQLVQLDGSGQVPAALLPATGITSLTAGTGLVGGGVSGALTLNVDVGTAALKIPRLNAGAQLALGDGSPAAPTYSFANSIGTGLYSSITNSLSLAANGTAGLTLNGSTGYVGIGTTAPNSRLDVNGSVRVGADATLCSASIQGSIRMNGTALEYCNGSSWSALSVGSGITALTGDVSAIGPGSAVSTINSVGGVTAANVASGVNLALAGTSANIANTLVKRDASGNLSAGMITANLTGNVTGNVSGSAASFTGSLAGDVTGTQSATVVAKVNGGLVPASAALLATNGSSQITAVSTVPASAMPAFTGGDVISSSGSLALTLTNSGATAGTYSKVTVDSKGRVTSAANLASGDITTALGFTPVNRAGDTMTGALNLPSNGFTVGTNQIVLYNGNVGIGTTNPNAILEVTGTGSQSAIIVPRDTANNRPSGINGMIRYNTDIGQLESYTNGSWQSIPTGSGANGAFINGGNAFGTPAALGTIDNNSLTFITNNSARGGIDTSGNFGIGTLTPQSKLDVSGGVAIGSSFSGTVSAPANGLIVQGNVGIGTTVPGTLLHVTPSTNGEAVRIANTGGTYGIKLGTGSGSGGIINFIQNASTNSLQVNGTGVIFLDGNGSKLKLKTQIAGNPGLLTGEESSSSPNLLIRGGEGSSNPGGAGGTLTLRSGNSTGTDIAGTATTIQGGAATGNAMGGDILFQTSDVGLSGSSVASSTTKIILKSSGNVGIGTTNPSTLLNVNGSFRAGSAINAGSFYVDSSVLKYYDGSSNEMVNIRPVGLSFFNGGNVGIGTATPTTKLDVNGSIRVGTDATACSTNLQGSIRMSGTNLEYCNGTAWTSFTAAAGISALTGDVTATGPGTATASIAFVGGVTAANIATGVNLALNGTSTNTANALVRRDASGNFSAGTISAALSGTASYATNVNTTATSTNASFYPLFVSSSASGYQAANVGAGISLNPSTNTVTATAFSGSQHLGSPSDTAFTPSFSWIGDTTTGLWRPAASTVALSTGGIERVRVLSSGNVGIGTTSPNVPLNIYSTGDTGLAIDSSVNAPYVGFRKAGADKWALVMERNTPAYGMATNDIGFYNHAQSKVNLMIQNSSGNIGIGLASPNGRLSVSSPDGIDVMALYRGASGMMTHEFYFDGGNDGGLTLWSGGTSGTRAINFTSKPGAANYFNNGGNVGVGTTTPAYRLDVNGAINATDIKVNGTSISASSQWGTDGTNVYRSTGNVGIGTAAPGAKVEIAAGAGNEHIAISSADGAGTRYLSSSSFEYPALTYHAWKDNGQQGVTGQISFTDRPGTSGYSAAVRTSDILFKTAHNWNGVVFGQYLDTTLAIVANQSGGNVGIGTTAPTQKLAVLGSADLLSDATLYFDGGHGSVGEASGVLKLNASNGIRMDKLVSMNRNTFYFDDIGNAGAKFDYNAVNSNTGDLYLRTSNAGIYSDTLTLYRNGNVGIGTTNPAVPLHLYAASPSLRLETSTSSGRYLTIQKDNAGQAIFTSTSDDNSTSLAAIVLNAANTSVRPILDIQAGGVSRMFVTNAGRVGIGTSTPNAILDLAGTGSQSALLVPRDNQASRPAGINGMIRYNTSTSGFEGYANGNWGPIGGSGAGGITSLTAGSGLTGGTITSTGTLAVNVGTGANQIPQLNASAQLALGGGSATTPSYSFANATGTGIYNPSGTNLALAAQGTAVLTITGSNGNVGIGTSTPAEALTTNGSIRSVSFNNGSSTSIDWSKGNTQYTSAGCTGTQYTFSNMRDGGSYTLLITGTFSANCTFGQTSPDTLSGTPGSGNFYFMPANTTAGGSNAIYSFMRIGNNVYVSWTYGFTN